MLSPPGLTSCFCERTDLFLPFRDLTHQGLGRPSHPRTQVSDTRFPGPAALAKQGSPREEGGLPTTSGASGRDCRVRELEKVRFRKITRVYIGVYVEIYCV